MHPSSGHASALLFLAATLFLAPWHAAPDEPGPDRLRVSVNPAVMALAEGGRAVVRVAAEGGVPVVTVSSGRIEGLHEMASGIYEAQFIPPDGTDPEVAIVSAVTPTAFGWATIELDGTREVVVKAPHRTLVSVDVEGQTFGPIPADARGLAVLRVTVPPGVHHATSRGQRFDLGVSDRGFVHVAADRDRLEANASAELTVRAFALTGRGTPHARAKLTLTSPLGALSAPVEVAPGIFQARWKLGPGPARPAGLTALVAGGGGGTATAVVQRVAGVPRSVALETDRQTLVAGEGDELGVTGRILDAAGNPTDAPARLVVSLGRGGAARLLPDAVIDWQRSGDGYAGRVQVPRQRAGEQELQLEMIVTSALRATRVVALLPGPPRALKVEAGELFGDGRARPLRVSVVDQHDNRTDAPAAPTVTADRGTVGAPVREAPGLYRVDYRGPVVFEGATDRVHAKLGQLQTEALLDIRGAGESVVLAPKVGLTAGEGDVRSFTAGAELGLWLRSVGLVVAGRWLQFSRTDTAPGTGLQVESEASLWGLDASLAWRRPVLRGMLWVSAGGGGVNVASKATIAGVPQQSGSVLVPAANAALSWGRPAGPGAPFGELRLDWQGDPGKGAVQGTFTSLTFNVGYRFHVL